MPLDTDFDELRNLFGEMKTILESEGETNWIRGIQVVLTILSPANPAPDHAKWDEARHTYSSMTGRAGSFSDHYIHREDFAERLLANQRLDEIKDRVWTLFDSNPTKL